MRLKVKKLQCIWIANNILLGRRYNFPTFLRNIMKTWHDLAPLISGIYLTKYKFLWNENCKGVLIKTCIQVQIKSRVSSKQSFNYAYQEISISHQQKVLNTNTQCLQFCGSKGHHLPIYFAEPYHDAIIGIRIAYWFT